MIRVFLSYAREDQERVERLYQNLAAAGFQPWMDVHDIEPGEEWQSAIDRGIDLADCFLACISSRSLAKAGVLLQEQKDALERWKKRKWWSQYRLIPVRLEDCQIPESMQHLHWFDLFRDEQWTDLAPVIRRRSRSRRWVFGGIAAVVLLSGLLIWKYFIGDERWPPGPVRIGVTVWRLQPADDSVPPGAKILVQPPPGSGSSPLGFQPVRTALETPFRTGDRVRVSFEAAQPGYLYVIDRERLNGGMGPPRMIFPTKRIGGSDNKVHKGQPVEIPGQLDSPPFWVLERQSERYAGERLTVVFAPDPVHGLEPGEDWRDLDESWFRSKLEQWEVPVSSSQNTVGTPATPAEIAAGQPGAKVLTQGDPLPQVVYSGEPKPGAPLAVSFDLRYRP